MKHIGVIIVLILVFWYIYVRYSIKDFFTDAQTSVIDIATGGNHTLFLTSNQNVFSCGLNNNGRLGLGNLKTTIAPTHISQATNIKKIYAGDKNSFFISSNGTFACGNNDNYQLGTGIESQYEQSLVYINRQNIESIAAGWLHTLFIDNNKNAYIVGYNNTGQLGLGHRTTIKNIEMLPINVQIDKIATGWGHTLFLTKDPSLVYSCGWNAYGQLGIGNNTEQLTPVPVIFPPTVKIVGIYAGMDYSMFISSTGQVYACGKNTNGQLGIGGTENYAVPTLISGLQQKIKYISSQYEHSMFVTENGEVYSCGRNDHGQLGLGDTTDYDVPQKIERLEEPIKKVCTGIGHTIFLSTSGVAYGCGKNTYGAVGTGDLVQHKIPVKCNIEFVKRDKADFRSIYMETPKQQQPPLQSQQLLSINIESQQEQTPTVQPITLSDSQTLKGRLLRRRFKLDSNIASLNTENFNRAFCNSLNTETIYTRRFRVPNDNHVALEYTGWITVPQSGNYTFGLTSDDGSDLALYIDGKWKLITSAYGYKPPEQNPPAPGKEYLEANTLYPIRIRFHEQGGGQALNVFWIPPNSSSFERIPFRVFRSARNKNIRGNNFPDPAVC